MRASSTCCSSCRAPGAVEGAPASTSPSRSSPSRAACSKRSTRPLRSSAIICLPTPRCSGLRSRPGSTRAKRGEALHRPSRRVSGSVPCSRGVRRSCGLRAAARATPELVCTRCRSPAGLRLPELKPEALAGVKQFDDPVYLHQVVESGPAGLTRYVDLPEALACLGWPCAGRPRMARALPCTGFRRRHRAFRPRSRSSARSCACTASSRCPAISRSRLTPGVCCRRICEPRHRSGDRARDGLGAGRVGGMTWRRRRRCARARAHLQSAYGLDQYAGRRDAGRRLGLSTRGCRC